MKGSLGLGLFHSAQVHDALVKVVAAEVRVAARREDLAHAWRIPRILFNIYC